MECRVSTGFVSQLTNMLEGEGLDSTRLCWEAGLDAYLLRSPDGFVPRSNVFCLIALAEQASGNPDIGLSACRHFLPGSLQLVGYVMMSSPNLKRALESMVQFFPLLGSGVTIGLTDEGDGLRFWGVDLPDEAELASRPRAFEDAAMASILGFCRWLTGGHLPRLREIEFTYTEPMDTTEHRRLFDCELRFDALRNSILFDRRALLQPLSTANEALALLHGRFAEHRIGQLYSSTYGDRVRTFLVERLSLGSCDMETVAACMHTSKRALQRGLTREGVHFKDLLDDARRQLADYYLRHSTYTLARVGELLGFKEPSSFHKACQRWFGTAPGRYRHHLSGAVYDC
ncbi:AraC family transcriptional regulator [Pseudomonas aeruginosa]|uniref:AraC family transcriptional regulator n=1 Tax=Pseudomonas aeruginosa TaxID=287 RepID=UPI00223834A3|nr:AraC family transcriptional regulator [Pseudomonas aeruginosa]MCW4646462.1 AraC family transcriptional regulator [Pseudomonas aeruginosa]